MAKFDLKIWYKKGFLLVEDLEVGYDGKRMEERSGYLRCFLDEHYPEWQKAMLLKTKKTSNDKIVESRLYVEK